ncbi:MAG: transporter [Planctomycetota bacterium]|nr:transporter [Planctomycetota bacterium]
MAHPARSVRTWIVSSFLVAIAVLCHAQCDAAESAACQVCGAVDCAAGCDVTGGADPDCCADCYNDCCDDCGCSLFGQLRCRKTLLHWPGGEVTYVTGDEEMEPIATDRPDFTENTALVGLGVGQVEFGYTYTRDTSNGDTVNAHSYPETLLRVGVLAEWIEMRVGWNYASNNNTIGGFADNTDGGEDLYLGMKFALMEQQGWLPALTLLPQMTVPTGSQEYTSDEVMPGLNVLYAWDLNDFLTLAASTQANRAFDGNGDYYEEYAQSISMGYSLTEKWGAYTEWFVLIPHNAEAADTTTQHYLDGGFTYLVNTIFSSTGEPVLA